MKSGETQTQPKLQSYIEVQLLILWFANFPMCHGIQHSVVHKGKHTGAFFYQPMLIFTHNQL